MKNNFTLTPLKRWLRKNNLKMNELADLLFCDRATLRAISDGKPVESGIARKVFFVTSGAVDPEIRRRGRPTCEHFHKRIK